MVSKNLEEKLKGKGEKRDLVKDTKELYRIIGSTYGRHTESMALSYFNTYRKIYGLGKEDVIYNVEVYEQYGK